jgi:16S rRNA (guanine527-N7)-methyltransferase
VTSDRIDRLPPLDVDVLSARALAPLDALLLYVEKHRRPAGTALFPKGATVHKEVEAAHRGWRFDARLHRSLTDPAAAIVEIGAVERV